VICIGNLNHLFFSGPSNIAGPAELSIPDVFSADVFRERDDAIGYGEAERGQESFLDEEALDAIDARAKCRADLAFQRVG
jgi:hypothetical protein